MKTKSILTVLVLCAAPSFAFAQQGDPLEAAKVIDACDGNRVIKAAWLDDGRLAVTCPKGVTDAGFATNFAIPLLFGAITAAAAAGGGGSTSGTN